MTFFSRLHGITGIMLFVSDLILKPRLRVPGYAQGSKFMNYDYKLVGFGCWYLG